MDILCDKDIIEGNSVVTIGSYDGVHYGHRKILEFLSQKGIEYGCKTAVLTLDPHPRKVLNLDLDKLNLLTSLKEKSYLLDKCGLSYLYIAEFTKEFRELSGEQYIKQYLVDRLKAKAVIIGYDHHFGKDRKNGYEVLVEMGAKYGFDVFEIPEQDIDSSNISSTTIRNLLNNGEIEKANKYLSEPYMFMGKIDANGKLIVEENLKLIPPQGLYATETEVDGHSIRTDISISKNKEIRFSDEKLFENESIVKIIHKKD